MHDNPTTTPLTECQYIACIQTDEKKEVLSQRVPKFKISNGVYAKFDLKGQHGICLNLSVGFIMSGWLTVNMKQRQNPLMQFIIRITFK